MEGNLLIFLSFIDVSLSLSFFLKTSKDIFLKKEIKRYVGIGGNTVLREEGGGEVKFLIKTDKILETEFLKGGIMVRLGREIKGNNKGME